MAKSYFRLLWQDFAVAISFIANIAAKYTTIAVETKLSNYVGSVTSVAAETNPLQKFLTAYGSLSAVATFATYGLIFAAYLLLRRNMLNKAKDQSQRLALDAFTLVLFFIFFFDALNDLSILAGILIH